MFFRRFPCYIQHNNMDCGATCLHMISSYYGQRYQLEYLRTLCNQTKFGVSLLGIQEAAKTLGFNAFGIKCSLDELQEIPCPCILHWNQSHFVVLYKIKKKKGKISYYISDPIGYRFKYTDNEIRKCWLNQETQMGMVLCLEPTSSFHNMNKSATNNTSTFKWLFKHLSYLKSQTINLIVGMLFCALLIVIFPFLTQSIVDYGVKNRSISFVITILIAQLVLIISSNLIEFIRNWLLLHIGVKINISIISEFILKLTKLPIAFFDARMTGDIIQRIGDHTRIKDFLTDASLNFVFSLITISVFGFVLLIYNKLVFIIFFIGSALYLLWVSFFLKKRAVLDNKMFAQNAATQSNVFELIYGMQEIKLNGCENQKRWDWERIQANIYKLLEKGLALAQYQASGAIIINQIKNAIITALVAAYTIDGKMTIGMLIAIQFIIGQLNSPIEQFVTFLRKYQDAKLSIHRLNDIYQMQNEIPETEPKIEIFNSDSITFSNVYYKYDKLAEEYVIKGISIMIPKGKCTAIVGLSGSGKTTLLKMILGFYEPDKGEIRIGDECLKKINMKEWRNKCGVVMQDGYIFSDTIASNIAPGNISDIDMNRVKEAAKIANINSFIETLPEGYQTKIGSEGKGLSMGQRQRILIARAVYKNPDYILLDEATNSLDANNEKEIMNSLNKFLNGKTSVIIAHRLSTVRNADNIIVLDNGSVAEEGCHDDLICKKGLYYSLVKNQLNV